jgi:hypothetical protein
LGRVRWGLLQTMEDSTSIEWWLLTSLFDMVMSFIAFGLLATPAIILVS